MDEAGFTLVELLLTISIIGFLATMSLITFDNTRLKARDARMNADLTQIILAIDLARNTKNTVLGGNGAGQGVTGRYWSEGHCIPGPWNGSFSDPLCLTYMNDAFRAIGFPQAPIDPWGHPYLIDENELENGNCNCDIIHSYGHSAGIKLTPYICNKCN